MTQGESLAVPFMVHEARGLETQAILKGFDPFIDGRSGDAVSPGDLSLGRRIANTQDDPGYQGVSRCEIIGLMAIHDLQEEVKDPDQMSHEQRIIPWVIILGLMGHLPDDSLDLLSPGMRLIGFQHLLIKLSHPSDRRIFD